MRKSTRVSKPSAKVIANQTQQSVKPAKPAPKPSPSKKVAPAPAPAPAPSPAPAPAPKTSPSKKVAPAPAPAPTPAPSPVLKSPPTKYDTITDTPIEIFEPDNQYWLKYFTPTDMLDDFADKYGTKLPVVYHNGIASLDIRREFIKPPKDILLSKLEAGDYQTATSKSDKNIASKIKTIVNNYPNFKKYKGIDNLAWLTHEDLMFVYDLLLYNWEKKNTLSTIKSTVNAFLRVLLLQYDSNYPLFVKYSIIGKATNEDLNEAEGENKLNENEQGRYLEFKYILKEQDELDKAFQSIANKFTKPAYDLHQDLLLLSLYCLIPPNRNELKSLEFIDHLTNDDGNFVYIRPDGKVFLLLNTIVKKHDPIKIEIKSDKLANIIKQSYQLYPRKYLFTVKTKFPDVSKQAKPSTLDNWITKIFSKYGVSVGVNVFRSSYVTNFFSKKRTYNEQFALATQMRTSIKQMLLAYNKILHNPQALVQVKPEPGVIKVKQEPNDDSDDSYASDSDRHVVVKVRNPYDDQLARSRKYYKENAREILDQQKEQRSKLPKGELFRRRVISYLNKDNKYKNKIQDKTIKKYNIKQDADGKYY